MNQLSTYVDSWRQSAGTLQQLCAGLTADEWAKPTDCPGWSVKDVVAHTAHLEHVLATGADPDGAELSGVVVSAYTELGVDARRDKTPAGLLDELHEAVERRAESLQTLPTDPHAVPAFTPGNVGWDWETLLRNRALDIWVHEQDIRRAVGKPGGMDAPGAHVTTMTLGFGMPYVLGKKVRPEPGTSCVWTVTGEVPFEIAAEVADDRRAHQVDVPAAPDVALQFSTEAFTILAAGRRGPEGLDVSVSGDEALGAAILSVMGVTP